MNQIRLYNELEEVKWLLDAIYSMLDALYIASTHPDTQTENGSPALWCLKEITGHACKKTTPILKAISNEEEEIVKND